MAVISGKRTISVVDSDLLLYELDLIVASGECSWSGYYGIDYQSLDSDFFIKGTLASFFKKSFIISPLVAGVTEHPNIVGW